MNNAFLSGRVRGQMRVSYTAQGEKVILFPLLIEEGPGTIDIIAKVPRGTVFDHRSAGTHVMVGGRIIVSGSESGRKIRLEATKIEWMED